MVLDRHIGSGAEILVKLVAVRGGVVGRACVRKATLAPLLRGIFVFCGAELAGSLGLLLERFLLLGVGEADLNLELLAIGLDGVVVECLDNLITSVTAVEAGGRSAVGL